MTTKLTQSCIIRDNQGLCSYGETETIDGIPCCGYTGDLYADEGEIELMGWGEHSGMRREYRAAGAAYTVIV